MFLLRTLVKVGGAASAGLGMTTAADDLASFLRSLADWVEAGGNVQLVLGLICGTLILWAAFDVRQFLRKPNSNRKPKQSHSVRNRVANPGLAEKAGTAPPALQKALEREAEAKAKSDQVDAEFRTARYNLNAALGNLLGLPSRKGETDKFREKSGHD